MPAKLNSKCCSASLFCGYWRSWLRWQRSIVPTIFGLFIGFLIALCLKFDFDNVATTFPASLDGASHSNDFFVLSQNINETTALRNIWLRCVVTVQPTTERIHKFVQAVEDTYARRCNETWVFTNLPALQKKFEESPTIRVFLVETALGPANWPYFHRILHFLAEEDAKKDKDKKQKKWTAVVNEQSYVVTENLRRLILTLDPLGAVVVGRVVSIKTLGSQFFPLFSAQSDTFVSEALLLFSHEALHRVAKSPICTPVGADSDGWQWNRWFFTPKYTGKALLKCVRSSDEEIRVLDPVDEEGYRLVVATNLRSLFSGLTSKKGLYSWFSIADNKIPLTVGKNASEFRVSSGCCSHNVIAFAALNYRDQRVVDFATTQLKVFGV